MYPATGDAAGEDKDDILTEACDLRLDHRFGSVANADHRDHRTNPYDDAEHREGGSQHIPL